MPRFLAEVTDGVLEFAMLMCVAAIASVALSSWLHFCVFSTLVCRTLTCVAFFLYSDRPHNRADSARVAMRVQLFSLVS